MFIIKLTRRLYRLILLILLFTVMFIISFCCCFGGFKAVKRATKTTHIWAKGIAKILNLKISVIGDTNNYKNSLIIANHSSYLDIIVHASLFPIRFTPKSDIRKWPILGQCIKTSRPIWIDRTSRQKAKVAMNKFADTIENGIPLIVYPEGTTNDNRGELLTFKTTLFEVAKKCSSSLLPIISFYDETNDKQSLAWYGEMKLLPHLWQILAQKNMHVTVKILPEIKIRNDENRKELAKRAYEIMNSNFKELAKKCENNKPKKQQLN